MTRNGLGGPISAEMAADLGMAEMGVGGGFLAARAIGFITIRGLEFLIELLGG